MDPEETLDFKNLLNEYLLSDAITAQSAGRKAASSLTTPAAGERGGDRDDCSLSVPLVRTDGLPRSVKWKRVFRGTDSQTDTAEREVNTH